MMGERRSGQGALFYEFSLEAHVPADHLLRRIDELIDFSEVRAELAPYYSAAGRPSICPELMIRMLVAGYCFGIRSERRLCDEVHLNLAYRWFCRLGLEGAVPDHSTFSKNRHGRFRESDIFRKLFDQVLRLCLNLRTSADQIPLVRDQRGLDANRFDFLRNQLHCPFLLRRINFDGLTIPQVERDCGGIGAAKEYRNDGLLRLAYGGPESHSEFQFLPGRPRRVPRQDKEKHGSLIKRRLNGALPILSGKNLLVSPHIKPLRLQLFSQPFDWQAVLR